MTGWVHDGGRECDRGLWRSGAMIGVPFRDSPARVGPARQAARWVAANQLMPGLCTAAPEYRLA